MRLINSSLVKPLLPLAVVGLFSVSAAEAALVVPAGNGLVVNDTDLNITWTQDANLFKTQADSFAGGAAAFVSAVIASVPDGRIYDTPNSLDTPANSGYRILATSDFNASSGTMSWWGAQAWVNYLNSISYAGVTGWQLPSTTDTGPAGCDNSNNGTDCGYNVDTNSSELAHVFFDELGNKSYRDTTGLIQSGYGVTNSGPFSSLQNTHYWSGTEYASTPAGAWIFFMGTGSQSFAISKTSKFSGWAVRPGQVAAVPVPAAVWLMGSALVGLLGLGRRKAGMLVIG